MVTIAPPLTRVHRLFRHRIITNELPKSPFKSEKVSRILVNKKLSNESILIDENHMRRGRDHLHDLVSLGLVTRTKTTDGFLYLKNPITKLLENYKFRDSCPKDLYETAFFADRLARMKLGNPNYSRRTYEDFRCRHFLNILVLLENMPLHISQIQYARSTKKDLLIDIKERKKLQKIFSKYPKRKTNAEKDFIESYFKTPDEKNEISRSSVPIIRWLQQTGMIFFDNNNWIHLTEKGVKCLQIYSNYFPVWYDDLGFSADIKAGILIAYNIAGYQNKLIDFSKLKNWEKDCIKEISMKYPFDKKLKKLKSRLCFHLYDSIGPDFRGTVASVAINILNTNKIKSNFLFPIETSIKELYNSFLETSQEREFIDLEKAFGFVLPRKETFQTSHEWVSCVQFIQLGLKARPYNGEFEGICDMRIAKENPDFIVQNSYTSLAECKSVKEWGEVLRLNKRVIGEFDIYQEYAEDVNANSAVFICESKKLDEDRYLKRFINKSKLDRLIIVNNTILLDIKNKKSAIKKFKEKLKSPQDYDMGDRIIFKST